MNNAYDIAVGIRRLRLSREPLTGPSSPKGVYTPDATEVDPDMGAIPAAVIGMPVRVRSLHPIRSFAAIGPRARDLIPRRRRSRAVRSPHEAGRPRRLGAADGGRLGQTAIHRTEQIAGRRMLRGWARGRDVCPGH